jgi:hypothetical protein
LLATAELAAPVDAPAVALNPTNGTASAAIATTSTAMKISLFILIVIPLQVFRNPVLELDISVERKQSGSISKDLSPMKFRSFVLSSCEPSPNWSETKTPEFDAALSPASALGLRDQKTVLLKSAERRHILTSARPQSNNKINLCDTFKQKTTTLGKEVPARKRASTVPHHTLNRSANSLGENKAHILERITTHCFCRHPTDLHSYHP